MNFDDIFTKWRMMVGEDADAMKASADLKIKAGRQQKKQAEVLKLQTKTADKKRELANISNPMTTPRT